MADGKTDATGKKLRPWHWDYWFGKVEDKIGDAVEKKVESSGFGKMMDEAISGFLNWLWSWMLPSDYAVNQAMIDGVADQKLNASLDNLLKPLVDLGVPATLKKNIATIIQTNIKDYWASADDKAKASQAVYDAVKKATADELNKLYPDQTDQHKIIAEAVADSVRKSVEKYYDQSIAAVGNEKDTADLKSNFPSFAAIAASDALNSLKQIKGASDLVAQIGLDALSKNPRALNALATAVKAGEGKTDNATYLTAQEIEALKSLKSTNAQTHAALVAELAKPNSLLHSAFSSAKDINFTDAGIQIVTDGSISPVLPWATGESKPAINLPGT